MASAKLEELERFLAEAGLQPAAAARALAVLQAVCERQGAIMPVVNEVFLQSKVAKNSSPAAR